MLALTKKTGYGLIAMSHLAGRGDEEFVSAREIADQFGVPVSLLMNVLKELAAAGYLESVRGLHGGYRLARRPEEIDLAGLVTVLEGPVRLAECVAVDGVDDESICEIVDHCPIADPVHRIHRKIRDLLKNVTLDEIVSPAEQAASKES